MFGSSSTMRAASSGFGPCGVPVPNIGRDCRQEGCHELAGLGATCDGRMPGNPFCQPTASVAFASRLQAQGPQISAVVTIYSQQCCDRSFVGAHKGKSTRPLVSSCRPHRRQIETAQTAWGRRRRLRSAPMPAAQGPRPPARVLSTSPAPGCFQCHAR